MLPSLRAPTGRATVPRQNLRCTPRMLKSIGVIDARYVAVAGGCVPALVRGGLSYGPGMASQVEDGWQVDYDRARHEVREWGGVRAR